MTGRELVVQGRDVVVDAEIVADVALVRTVQPGGGGEVVDAEPVGPLPYVSPLAGLAGWTGGVVMDLAEVEAIRARVEYGRLRWWRRVLRARPPGWRSAALCGTCGAGLYTNGTCPNCDRPRHKQVTA